MLQIEYLLLVRMAALVTGHHLIAIPEFHVRCIRFRLHGHAWLQGNRIRIGLDTNATTWIYNRERYICEIKAFVRASQQMFTFNHHCFADWLWPAGDDPAFLI